MTAYAPATTDPTAVMGRRILAALIDGLLVAIILAAVGYSIFSSSSVEASSSDVRCSSDSSSSSDSTSTNSDNGVTFCFRNGDRVRYLPNNKEAGFVWSIYGLSFGLSLVNLVLLQGVTGASIGKLITGLRVVDAEGRRAGIGRTVGRWLMLIVDGLCCAIPGMIAAFSSKGHKRVGDMVAGTFVVSKSSTGSPLQPGAAGYGPGYAAGSPTGWAEAPSGPTSWGQASSGGASWSPPASSTVGVPAGSPVGGEGPQWDAARNAYIQYDRDLSAWLQWNDAAGEWRPIDQ